MGPIVDKGRLWNSGKYFPSFTTSLGHFYLKHPMMRKMSPLVPFFDRFWRGTLALSPFSQRFGSATQLPLHLVRKIQLPGPVTPKSRFSHLPRIFARSVLFLLPALLLVAFFSIRAFRHSFHEESPTQVPSLSANWQTSLDLSTKSLSQRPIFPYSIVPGGVRDARELQNAAARDSVVAKHYSDFRIIQAHTLLLSRPLKMYVSYRKNNQVYWTKNRMLIPAGETLISDGENLARVRCANRLSPVAAKPVAVSEPTTEELSDPIFVPPLLAQLLPGEGSEFSPTSADGIPAGPLAAKGPGGISDSLGLPVFPPILGPGVPPLVPHNPVPSPPNNPVPPPPVSTPEPSSFWLLTTGVVLAALFTVFSLRRNSSA
jgi:hypothetical protein